GAHAGDMHEHNEAMQPAGGEHVHVHKEHGPTQDSRVVNWIGRFHPPTTNFPIGVLVAAAIAEFLFMVSKRGLFDDAARFCVVFAVIGAIAAGILGWCFGGFRLSDSDNLLMIHRWLGTGTVVWLI